MGNQAMLLRKHTAVRKGRIHDGKVMFVRSNLRWCSDSHLAEWQGYLSRLHIDSFDREIIAWAAVANAASVASMMVSAKHLRRHGMRWSVTKSRFM